MSSIDTRVVEAKFNNQQFGKGVNDTIGSLDRLKAGLKLDGAAAGIQGVNAAANSFNSSQMEQGAGRIGGAFSAMESMALGAFASIGAKFASTALELAKGLTIGPIKGGLDDYHAKLTSVQTIMNATGADMGTVNGYFKELDTYADKTIYNLTDMTGAFAKFTNAGVGMDKSVPAIKGIANMVALAGQGADAAGIAMYNLSQSIAGGFLTTTDYKSLNLANVATKEWKNQMIDGAIAAGKLKKVGADSYHIVGTKAGAAASGAQLFNEQLKEGWASSDVLLSVLGKYGDTTTDIGKKSQAAAQDVKSFPMMMDTLKASVGTGWTDTFEILLGNVDESKQLFTGLTNAISGFLGGFADSRNELLAGWKVLGGRTALIDGLKNTFQALFGVLKPIGEAFRNIFPKTTSSDLASMTQNFRDFMKTLIPAPETVDRIRRTFEGVFAVLHIGWTIVKALATFLFDMFAGVEEGDKGILKFTATIGDFLVGLDKAITKGGGVTKFFNTLRDLLFVVINPIKNFASAIGDAFAGVDLGPFGKSLGNFISSLLSFGSAADETAKKSSSAADTVKAVFSGFTGMAQKLADIVERFAKAIAHAFEGLDFDKVMAGLQTGGILGMVGTLAQLTGAIKKFSLFGGGNPGGIFSGIKQGLNELSGTMKSMQNENNAGALMKLAAAIGLLALSVMLLASIDPKALIQATIAMGILFVELTKGMAAFNAAVGIMGAAKLNLLVPALIGIAIAVLLLVAAVKILTLLDWKGLAKGLFGLAAILGMLVGAVQVLSKHNKRIIQTGVGLMFMAVAINLLVGAVWLISMMDWDKLAKGLIGVGAILTGLALFTRFAKAGLSAVSQGFAILLLAGAILVLATAVEKMGSMSWDDMIRGLVGMGAALVGMAIIMERIGNDPKNLLAAIAIAHVAGALGKIAEVFIEMSRLDWGQTIRGMMGFATSFGMIIMAIKAVEKVNFAQLGALSLVTDSMRTVAEALSLMGEMSWDEIIRGLVGMIGTIGVLVIALIALDKVPADSGVALGVVAASLALLAPALKTMSEIPIAGIVGALVLLAGVFIVVGVAAWALSGSIPIIIGLAAGIALLGFAVMLAGAGTLMFAVALTMLGAAAAIGGAGIVAMFSMIVGLIPLVMQQVGLGLVALANVIAVSAPAFVAAMAAVLTALLTAIIQVLPQVALLIMTLVDLIVKILVDGVPKLIVAGLVIIIAFLTGIANAMPAIVDAGMRIIINFLDGIARNIGRVIDKAVDVIVAFIDGIGRNIGRVIQAGYDLVLDFIHGIADAARNNGAAMADAGWDLASGIVEGFVKGLGAMAGHVKDAAVGMAKGALNGAKDFLGINSPSKKFIEIGMGVNEGMRDGINDYAHLSTRATEKMGKGVLTTMGKTISGLGDMIGNGMDTLAPVITPVLDLSNIQRDSSQIGQMLGTAPIGLSGSLSRAADASAGYNANQAALAELAAQAGTNVNLTQVNNSPKALSAVEIYRQTNNQLSQVKGALTNAK